MGQMFFFFWQLTACLDFEELCLWKFINNKDTPILQGLDKHLQNYPLHQDLAFVQALNCLMWLVCLSCIPCPCSLGKSLFKFRNYDQQNMLGFKLVNFHIDPLASLDSFQALQFSRLESFRVLNESNLNNFRIQC